MGTCFTLGMYYAFNRTLLETSTYTNPLIKQIILYGQYAVLMILLFELFNYFYNQLDFKKYSAHKMSNKKVP